MVTVDTTANTIDTTEEPCPKSSGFARIAGAVLSTIIFTFYLIGLGILLFISYNLLTKKENPINFETKIYDFFKGKTATAL
jgi:hypothetical protein